MSKQFNKLAAAAQKEGLDLQRLVRGGSSPRGNLVERVTYQVTRISDRKLLCSGFLNPFGALAFARSQKDTP